jgi:hypothetical protein
MKASTGWRYENFHQIEILKLPLEGDMQGDMEASTGWRYTGEAFTSRNYGSIHLRVIWKNCLEGDREAITRRIYIWKYLHREKCNYRLGEDTTADSKLGRSYRNYR